MNEHTITAETVDTLNDLIQTAKEGERDFRSCAENAHAEDLRHLLRRRSEEYRVAASELRWHLRRLGGTDATKASMMAGPRRGWVASHSIIASYTDQATLEVFERNEDAVLERYADVLGRPLESPV